MNTQNYFISLPIGNYGYEFSDNHECTEIHKRIGICFNLSVLILLYCNKDDERNIIFLGT